MWTNLNFFNGSYLIYLDCYMLTMALHQHLQNRNKRKKREGKRKNNCLRWLFWSPAGGLQYCEQARALLNGDRMAHVTFDRFNGFLGLLVELEPEVPRRAPSARFVASIFMS